MTVGWLNFLIIVGSYLGIKFHPKPKKEPTVTITINKDGTTTRTVDNDK